MKRMLHLALLMATAALASPSLSMAQSGASGATSNFARDRNVTVRERPRPDFEAAGVRLGGFTAYPRLGLSVIHDDNIYATASGEQEDNIWRLRPEVVVSSNWSRHSLAAFARADVRRFQDNSTEDTTDYALGGSARLDFLTFSKVEAGASRAYLTEPRSSPNAAAAAAEPTRYYVDRANLGVSHELNRLRLVARTEYAGYDYRSVAARSGGVVDQQARDRNELAETFRAEYAVSPDTSFYGVVVFNQRDYRLKPPSTTFDRDSNGYEAAVGASFDLSALVRGEVQVGYLEQNYDSSAFKGIDGFALRAGVDWFPTELTTLNFTASRSVEETVNISSPGYLETLVSARVDHELMRNVLLSATLGYANDDYQQIDRTDKIKSAGVSGTYLLNRSVGLTLSYDYQDRASSGSASTNDFTDNKVSAGITLQL